MGIPGEPPGEPAHQVKLRVDESISHAMGLQPG
jgi:hypothetical protein